MSRRAPPHLRQAEAEGTAATSEALSGPPPRPPRQNTQETAEQIPPVASPSPRANETARFRRNINDTMHYPSSVACRSKDHEKNNKEELQEQEEADDLCKKQQPTTTMLANPSSLAFLARPPLGGILQEPGVLPGKEPPVQQDHVETLLLLDNPLFPAPPPSQHSILDEEDAVPPGAYPINGSANSRGSEVGSHGDEGTVEYSLFHLQDRTSSSAAAGWDLPSAPTADRGRAQQEELPEQDVEQVGRQRPRIPSLLEVQAYTVEEEQPAMSHPTLLVEAVRVNQDPMMFNDNPDKCRRLYKLLGLGGCAFAVAMALIVVVLLLSGLTATSSAPTTTPVASPPPSTIGNATLFPTTWTPQEVAKLVASDGDAASAWFGVAVAIDSDTLAVGAPWEDSVYVYTRSMGGVWILQVTLTMTGDSSYGDEFGFALAISDETLVVGARGYNDHAGTAYVYVRAPNGQWGLQTQLLAEDGTTNDYFGWSVAIFADTIVVGAYDVTSFRGSAYIFAKSSGTSSTTWSQQAKLATSDGDSTATAFGWSVAISDETVVVGARLEGDQGGGASNSAGGGSVYIFSKSGTTTWNQTAKLVASDASIGDAFGRSVAISGDKIAVGADGDDDGGQRSGSVYVFGRSGATWSQEAKLMADDASTEDRFGWSVAMSGETLVIGAYRDDDGGNNSGSAYVYRMSPGTTTWNQIAKLTASDAQAGDNFGYAVAISNESVIVVGAWGDDQNGVTDSGSAYIFE